MRTACFSPLPCERTRVAGYSALRGPLAATAGLGSGSDTAEANEIARRLAEVSGP